MASSSSWNPPAGMFSWFSCWNHLGRNVLVGFLLEFHEKRFHSSSCVPWSLWGVESRGIPKPSPPGLPTALRHLISVETWSSDQCATASATGRRELSHSHFQLAAGNRENLQAANPETREEVGSFYLGLGSSYLLSGWPVPQNSKPRFPLLNGNEYLPQNCCYSQSQDRPLIFPCTWDPWCYLAIHCLCRAFIFQGFSLFLS